MPEFKLPDVGEGLTEAEIVTWKVKVGDVIEINDVVVEIETAKSLVELPSPYAGEVTALLVPEGETDLHFLDLRDSALTMLASDLSGLFKWGILWESGRCRRFLSSGQTSITCLIFLARSPMATGLGRTSTPFGS